jgi:hypothetical protein
VPANVASWSGDASRPTLDLFVGTWDGVRVGSVVVSRFNLVGRVISTGDFVCTVQLTIKPNASLFVRFAPPIKEGQLPPEPSERQIVRVVYDLEREAFAAIVDESIRVEVGDLAFMHVGNVRSSDDQWSTEADGFVVGKVVSKEQSPDNPQMQHEVLVKPVIDLPRLTRAVVRVVTEERVGVRNGGGDQPTQ